MKKTLYQIEGQSEVEPTELPEGFTVKEVEVDDPRYVEVRNIFEDKTLSVEAYEGGRAILRVTDAPRDKMVQGIYSATSLREVRDALNAILGDKPTLRVFKDHDGDLWFETKPGSFTYATSRPDAEEKAHIGDSMYANWDEGRLRSDFRVEDVTKEH